MTVRTINRSLRRYLNFTFKRLKRPLGDRFAQGNMFYTQAYIDYCQTKQPHQIKFMDESGFKITCANRNHGHSEKGTPCIEIGRYIPGRNLSLNLLVSVDCVLYYNFIDGPSNTETYLNFWQEASLGQDDYGRLIFLPGDVVIVDNCAIHHNQAERVSNFFGLKGIDYGFLPTHSPDFNPAENCFGKIKKKVLSQERFHAIVGQNLKFAITQAMKEISKMI